MKIKIQKLNGNTISIEVQKFETVRDIKKKIQQKTGMAPEQQKLIFLEEILNDDNKSLDAEKLKKSPIELLSINSVKIYVQKFPFEASKDERIIDLKKKIARKIKKTPDEHILLFHELYLRNNTFVGDYRITDQSVIEVHPKLKNGIVILINTTDQVVATCQVLKAERISDLKKKIHELHKIAPDQQKLTFNGALLEDDKTFDESEIGDESDIHIDAQFGCRIRVFVKTMDGKVFTFEVKKHERIINIKKRIEEKSGLAYDDQNLNFEGESLENDKCVNDYKINNDSIINVLAHLKGGTEIFAKIFEDLLLLGESVLLRERFTMILIEPHLKTFCY